MRIRIPVLAVTVAATAAACGERLTAPEITDVTPPLSTKVTGNGAPSGSHYNLNIIGVSKEKTADMTGSKGHVIFVPLGSAPGKKGNGNKKTTQILLTAGDDFQVVDKNGTDGRASFQLPTDVSSTYQVFARALGTPGGKAEMLLCATDPGEDGIVGTEDDEEICGGTEVFVRDHPKKKNNKFADVSETLLFIQTTVDPESTLGQCLELDTDPEVDEPEEEVTLELFNTCLEGYLWNYTNQGLKLLQFRFYPME